MDTQPQPEKLTPIEFVKQKLSINPEATFADIRAQAKVEGINVFPVVYGRAKALLGLVPTAAYGSKSKKAEASAAPPKPAASRPEPAAEEPEPRPAESARQALEQGRIELEEAAPEADEALIVDPAPARAKGRTARAKAAAAAAKDPADGLAAMVEDLRSAVRQRDRYRALLVKLGALIEEALDEA